MVDGSVRKKRREQNATVPGRRVRKQIGVEKHVDEEVATRMKRIPGRLRKLGARKVAEMLAEEALSGEMTPMMLLLRLSGCLKNR
jgi:hypothetical protein